ncbi:glycosyltransferase family 2 protein [uncultured Winogradskyella sp.]|uniref:glycosyltransferase family 2 protein n=1 Tax=uncultured Winogradskyella sp. TaxID=395353 RepID=UPI0035153D48
MRIGLVITVKNEERILRKNLLYHNEIGIDKAFVYFDGTTDAGRESIQDLKYVELLNSIGKDIYESSKGLINFIKNYEEHHTARQCLNTYDALQKCKQENIDWLISIDADELIITHLTECSNLKSLFDKIPESYDVVNFKPFEVLQTQIHFNNVFKESILFKSSPKIKNRIDRVYKKLFNPFENKFHKFSYWYGQHLGKTAIRVNSSKEIVPKNVHRVVYEDNSSINCIDKLGMLHYHMYDSNDFIKKFKNFEKHPDTFLSGNNIEGIKMLCRDIVNSGLYNSRQLEDYFKKYILFNEKEVNKLKNNRNRLLQKRQQATITKITSVNKVFSKINS